MSTSHAARAYPQSAGRPWSRWLIGLALFAALVGVGAACTSSSGSDDGANETPSTANDPTTNPSSGTQDGSETIENDSDPGDFAVDEPAEELISAGALLASEPIIDPAGNIVTVYSVTAWPHSWADAGALGSSAVPMAANIGQEWAPATNLLAVDVSLCVNGDVSGSDVDGTYEFAIETPGNGSASGLVRLGSFSVVSPKFERPAAGDCARGFAPVTWVGPIPERAEVSYILNQRVGDSQEVLRSSYLWSIPVDPSDSLTPTGLAAGTTVTFEQGALAGATVRFDGWAELIGVDSPVAETRLIAALIETCPGSGSMLEFGFATSHWNLATTIDMPLLALDRYVPSSEQCSSGWIVGAVPVGSEPTGFWVGESGDVDPLAHWSFVDAALPSP